MPIAVACACYVIANLVCFTACGAAGERPPVVFLLLYAAVAIGVSSGGAWLLWRRRAMLRD